MESSSSSTSEHSLQSIQTSGIDNILDIHTNIGSTDQIEENKSENITNRVHGIGDTNDTGSIHDKPPRRIDVHHHIIPDFYAKVIEESGGDPFGWSTPTWSIEQAKSNMALLGISTSIVSIPAFDKNGSSDNKEKGRTLSRKLNEFSSDLVKNNPKQFGFFASLPPLTDVEGALNEIDYAHSVLKSNGFLIFTSYGHGQYLGHPSFESIWEKFNQLKAVVFIHPSEAPTSIVNRYLPQPLIDFPHETTRTASDLVLSGTRAAFPDVKIILCHAGGTLPFLARRISMGGSMPFLHCPRTQDQILDDFRSFYYDTALSTSTIQLRALLEFADPSKILFGSDIPYAPLPAAGAFTKDLDKFFLNKSAQHESVWEAINHQNAKRLFPKILQD